MFDVNLSQLLPNTPANPDAVTTTIKVDGDTINSAYEVKSIIINKSVRRIPFALITLIDGSVSEQRFEISDTNVFTPGNEIELSVGHRSEEETIFKGLIIKHGVKVKSGRPSILEIECKDLAVKMTIGRKNQYFLNKTDTEIIEEIANLHGIGQEVDTPDIQVNHTEMVQYYVTDWDFVNTRAEANGLMVIADDNLLKVKKVDLQQDPALVLNFGTSIYEFEAEMDARDQYPAVKTTAWDPASQELKEAIADDNGVSSGSSGGGGVLGSVAGAAAAAGGALLSGGGIAGAGAAALQSIVGGLTGEDPETDFREVIGLEEFDMQHPGKLTEEELQAWAKAQYTKSQLSKLKGRVKFEGDATLRPGQMIHLQGVGARHEGTVYVTAITHQINDGSWFTTAQFGLDQRWFAQDYEDLCEQPASSLIPAISGLQIGIVTNLESDPDNNHRIQVRLPLIDTQSEGIWARVATLDAGQDRGSFFLPELEDEVIVGFLNDDPRDPIILGMVNSSDKPAPLIAANDNHEKGFVTRSGIKMIFNDEDVSLIIETPNGKKITIDEAEDIIQLEDNFSNKILMDQAGITIESGQDLTLKAANQVSIEGVNIQNEASAEFKVQSQAKSELASSGETVIQGSFVRIN